MSREAREREKWNGEKKRVFENVWLTTDNCIR